jgi:hypothetical protein
VRPINHRSQQRDHRRSNPPPLNTHTHTYSTTTGRSAMADADATVAAAMDVVDAAVGARNSVEMPLATELTAGVAGMEDTGPEEVCCACVRGWLVDSLEGLGGLGRRFFAWWWWWWWWWRWCRSTTERLMGRFRGSCVG